MIRIAIVDDERNMHEFIRKCISLCKIEESIEIEDYDAASDFIEAMESGGKCDILLLDISMPAMNGLTLGQMVKDRWQDVCLVFLTSHVEYAIESYRMNADQYVLKSQAKERLPEVLSLLIEKIKMRDLRWRMLRPMGELEEKTERVYYKDIIYIYKDKGTKYIHYVTTEGEYRERITIEEIQKELKSPNFVMVERSILLNLLYITGMDKSNIYLEGGYKIPVSRSRYVKIKQYIHEYGAYELQ